MNFYKNGTNGGCGFDFGLQMKILKERMGLFFFFGANYFPFVWFEKEGTWKICAYTFVTL